MAFSVNVYLPEHLPLINQVPENPKEMDSWLEDCAKLCLFDAPLGSEGILGDYWSRVAQEINLPLIGSIYDEGLQLAHTEIPELESELEKLEDYWDRNSLEDVEKYDSAEDSIKADLRERLGYLREAARVARANKAVLIIS